MPPNFTHRPAERHERAGHLESGRELVGVQVRRSRVRPGRRFCSSTATAIRLAALATSLLIAEAAPAYLELTAPSTVEVSGATLMASPNPNTSTAGSTSVR